MGSSIESVVRSAVGSAIRSAAWAKWWQTIQVSWSNLMAYKLNFVLMVIGPAIVFFFVKYNLWVSIYKINDGAVIRGYDLKTMLTYQAWVMVVGFIAKGHTAMNLAQDIRMGRISAYLIYPFKFWQFHTANFIGFQLVQLFVSVFTVLTLYSTGLIETLSLRLMVSGFLYCTVVGFLWFALQYIAGLISFWLEETWMIRVFLSIVVTFLSGGILPLEVFPQALQKFLQYTPFPYLTYVPVKLFMGEYTGSLLLAYSILLGWMVCLYLVAGLIWRRGLRLYTAAGM